MKVNFRPGLAVGALSLCAVAALAVYRGSQTQAAPETMASMLPPGALLTIESPDFRALLKDWNGSAEQKTWMAGDNFRVLSNSRLFGRLNDARAEFEAAARVSAKKPQAPGSALNGDFLTEIAGGQSAFAWYDVGNLEFVYESRVSAQQASGFSLLKDRAAWTVRQSAGLTFYLRTSGASVSAEAAEAQPASAQGKARTVAFAVVPSPAGDLLVLATREDLMVNALLLMQKPAPADSLAAESWFADASRALPKSGAPDLHMVLNLQRIVPLPYFRSYWVQRNVTDMGRYRAAVTDLYREPHRFREERALLLKSPPEDAAEEANLGALTARLPVDGVYAATATTDVDEAVEALEKKLLGRMQPMATAETEAPDPTLDAPRSGSGKDFETRIDTLSPVTPAAANSALADALQAAKLDALVTYSAAAPPASAGGLWVPIRSAVLLHAGSAWNAGALEAALQQNLRGALTAGDLGLVFRTENAAGHSFFTLSGPKPLFLAIDGPVCLLADDRELMLSILGARAATVAGQKATHLAGFQHAPQRGPFLRLAALIDGTNRQPEQAAAAAATASGSAEKATQPAFLSGNMRSLSDSFAALGSESFTERQESASTVRQTVIYTWR